MPHMALKVGHAMSPSLRHLFRSFPSCAAAGLGVLLAVSTARSAEGEAQESAPRPIYIREYRVTGSQSLPPIEVQEAVYPFLGPGRTPTDVEQARAALEKAYQEKGYKAASVSVPEQSGRGGIVLLEVREGTVGRLRVKNARYFMPSAMKAQARSLAEGKVINFNDVQRDVVSLNQLPDRRVEPKLNPTDKPGVYDIELLVKDKSPLHGSLELNNRYSANTPELRLSGALSYGNLWQLGHTVGTSFQISPEDLAKVKVFTAYYLARFPGNDWLSVLLQGVKQHSDVSTLGGVAVAGRGEIVGLRAIATLPGRPGFFHSFTAGMDYKHFDQNVTVGLTTDQTPIHYYPLSVNYSGTWVGKKSLTELNAGATMGLRGMGSRGRNYERNRFGSDGNFFYFRGDLSRTQQLPYGLALFGKVQGQAAGAPLVNSEQFGGGGLNTARGYLEAEALGDNAIFGTLELRSPSLLTEKRKIGEGENATEEPTGNEWRFYAFGDVGTLTSHEPLPDQESHFNLASIGIGSRFQLLNHFNGSVDLALPLTSLTDTHAHDPRVTFRVWADF